VTSVRTVFSVATPIALILSGAPVAGQGTSVAAPAEASLNAVSAPKLSAQPGLRLAPALRAPTQQGNDMPAFLAGQRAEGESAGHVILTGAAQVRRRDTVLKADRIDYAQDSGDLDAQGNVRLRRDADLLTGARLRYNIETESGSVDAAQFWLGLNGGSGSAEHAELFSRSRMRFTRVTYTGCDCIEPAWEIRAARVDLDLDENAGVARGGVLYFKGIPILASPYLTFPLRDARKSGLLVPTYGTTSSSGFEISTPYYLNLAPNYDATITPRYLAKRGMQAAGEFRYLGRSYQGEFSGTYLARDRRLGEKRWLYSSRHQHNLGRGFYANWNVAGVSDNDYFRDFSTLGLNEASTTYLAREARLGWDGRYARGFARVYRSQSLHITDALSRIPQYDKMPEVVLAGARYDWRGLDVEVDGSATWFRPLIGEQLIGGLWQDRRFGPDGQRFALYPSLTLPIVRPGWYIKPKAGVHYSHYDTQWYVGNPRNTADYNSQYVNIYGSPRDGGISRTQPIFSLDAGLIFDREASFFGKPVTQTLEPRLYYLRVPFREQRGVPVYDTSLADFSFAQAFQENIYTGGWDRIANANQLTVGLTTRFLDAGSGAERFTVSGAQRLYFENQRVTLLNEQPREGARSEYLVNTTAALTDTLSVQAALQYNTYQSQWDRAMAGLRWKPQRLTLVSLSYRYQRDALSNTKVPVPFAPRGQNQLSLAFQWPLHPRWYAVGRVDYSLRRNRQTGTLRSERRRITQAIAGLEYKGDCCWTARAVFQRYAVDARKSNTAVFFQLELHGLGMLGTDPLQMLSRSIPGYESVTPPTRPATTFERYE